MVIFQNPRRVKHEIVLYLCYGLSHCTIYPVGNLHMPIGYIKYMVNTFQAKPTLRFEGSICYRPGQCRDFTGEFTNSVGTDNQVHCTKLPLFATSCDRYQIFVKRQIMPTSATW